ncbi:MAG: amidohydrolase family protein [Rhodospirillales bacterium]
MARTLIKNACIVTVDSALGDINGGDILIENDRIAAVGRNLQAGDAETIDASGMIAMPGLINAHIHTWEIGLRGIGANWAGGDYFRHLHHNMVDLYQPQDNYIANLMGSLSQINGGTTTIFDWCHNLRTPDQSDASIDGLEESGIRAVFGHGTTKSPPKPGETPFWEIPHPDAEIRRLRTGRLASDDRLVTLAMCILGPDESTYEVTAHDIRLAREYGLITSAHTWGRAPRINDRGMFRLAADGLLGPDHNITHGNNLADDELKVTIDAGVSITATPSTEMLNTSHIALLGRVLDLGGRPSLGTDVDAYMTGSMLALMRDAFQLQRMADNRKLDEQDQWPAKRHRMRPRMVLEWATMENAKALRLDHKIGSLTPGKQADIVLIRKDDIGIFPAEDPIHVIVMYCETADVDTVFVAGKKVKANGKLVYDPALLEKKKQELAQSRQRIFTAGKFVYAE